MTKRPKTGIATLIAMALTAPVNLLAAVDPSKINGKMGEWGNVFKNGAFIFAGVAGICLLIWGGFEIYKGKQEGGDKTKAVLILVVGIVFLSLAGVITALDLGPSAEDANQIDFGKFK